MLPGVLQHTCPGTAAAGADGHGARREQEARGEGEEISPLQCPGLPWQNCRGLKRSHRLGGSSIKKNCIMLLW